MTLNCTNISLKKGSKGALVTELQRGLKQLGYYVTYNGHRLVVDGNYGSYTVWAVKKFQKATGHTQDGWFGPKTCKSFNQKLNAEQGIAVSNTTPTTVQSDGTTAVQVTRENPYIIDVSKNTRNASNSNIHIQGLHFLTTSFTFDTPNNNGEWNSVALADGHFDTSVGHDVPRAYTFETMLRLAEYKQLESELVKMEKQVCRVACDYFRTGRFTVKYTPSIVNARYIKLTVKLTEYY
jgi:peptidoglycan hydrolase-like protein with peptidoglycan-binding domain